MSTVLSLMEPQIHNTYKHNCKNWKSNSTLIST